MAGTLVESVVITASGTGFTGNPTISFSGGGGTGAAATATAYTGSLRPMSFFKGRYNDLYGVDGMGRGIRWDGAATAADAIGVIKPAVAPAVTASTTGFSGRVVAVQMVNSGAGYNAPPAVTFVGTASSTARARATVFNGRISEVVVTDGGAGYSATPAVEIAGGIGSGAAFNVGVLGQVDTIEIINGGAGYTSAGSLAPQVTFSTAQGLTDARAIVTVADDGSIDSVFVTASGTGATTSPVTATITAGTGSGAQLKVHMLYGVAAITASTSGSGYHTAPIITFRAASEDPYGVGAAATAFVNTTGNVTGASVYAAGQYRKPPTALILDTSAKATATVQQPFRGKYLCCVRYISGPSDDPSRQTASSISDLFEIDAGNAAQAFYWNVTHTAVDARVSAMELWRTSGDQSVILFRVATIKTTDAAWNGTYVDAVDDDRLTDPEREGYGLMPITLPSGQVNARRFGVPPGEFAVACVFQDRAWYAVDVTGDRPNSLLFSEVDELESVPEENELVLQENTGSPDKIVALIPFASQLLIAQSAHLYSLSYVAQPVLDASMRLVSYRGVLNNRCWGVLGGVAYLVDDSGMYAFDGSSQQPVSVAVDNFWQDKIIDFSKADKFHVRADAGRRVVRFFYCQAADTEPVRALCYGIATQAWWEETYATAVTASCAAALNGKNEPVYGLASGSWMKSGGSDDAGSAIPYLYRTGPLPVNSESGSRAVSFLYKPTAATANLGLRVHYNNSSQPRPNAVASNRGDGFVTDTGSTEVVLNMSLSRSQLGNAVGYAKAHFAGRADDRSAGADRHVAVAVGGTQPSGDPVVIYGIAMDGVG
jgi:hypothetical protein